MAPEHPEAVVIRTYCKRRLTSQRDKTGDYTAETLRDKGFRDSVEKHIQRNAKNAYKGFSP